MELWANYLKDFYIFLGFTALSAIGVIILVFILLLTYLAATNIIKGFVIGVNRKLEEQEK